MDIVEKNSKNFNLYVFISTFSRGLIEVFIGSILYKAGFSLIEVITYYLMVNVVSLVLTKPFLELSKRTSNRVLAILGVIFFVLVQIILNRIVMSHGYLFILASCYAIYRISYWISRRFYNLKIIQKENISNSYTVISILNQIALVVSAYVGAVLLDFVSINVLTIISIGLFLLSVIPLYKLKFTHEHNNEKLNLVKTMNKIGFSNLYIFGSYELLNLIKFFVPLYLFIYVKDNYQLIGLLSVIQSVATMVVSYLYGRAINKEKNYLKFCIVFLVIVYVLKVNSLGIMLGIISFLEGFATKMCELSISKNFYSLSKSFEYYNYNYVQEMILNIIRTLVLVICLVVTKDIKVMIYITLFFMFISVFFNFKFKGNGNYKVK